MEIELENNDSVEKYKEVDKWRRKARIRIQPEPYRFIKSENGN